MTLYLLDVASYQGALKVTDVVRAGFHIVNLKISHGLTQSSVHPDIGAWITRARTADLSLCTFHWLDKSASGRAQADYAYGRMKALGLTTAGHVCDCESDATEPIFKDYTARMKTLLGRPVGLYTGDWWWTAPRRGWAGATSSPFLHAAPNNGYLPYYPGDASPHWKAGYGGWPALSLMQYGVGPLKYPDGSSGSIHVSQSAIRDPQVWAALTSGGTVGWSLAPSLVTLRSEFNQVAPLRDKTSDGSIGDTAHQAAVSDHNPDSDGIVHAIDVDKDGPWPAGWSMESFVQILLGECRAGREKRLKYIIYNRRIWSASGGWKQRAYSGVNPHDKHAHFSAVSVTALERATGPYGLVEAVEDAVALDNADLAKIRELVKGLLVSDPDVKLQLAARAWQYVGGGLPPGTTGTLAGFTETITNTRSLITLTRALIADSGTLTTEQVVELGKAIGEALVVPLTIAIGKILEPAVGGAGIDETRLREIVEEAVRDVLNTGVDSPSV